jgi:hypothetical protein
LPGLAVEGLERVTTATETSSAARGLAPVEAITPEGFEAVQTEILKSEIRINPSRAWYPSSIGHPCDRFLVWRFNRHEEQQRHSPELQSIFNEGRAHQALIYERLRAMGFRIVEESDRPAQYRVGGALISGRPDGRIIEFRGQRFYPALSLEAKTMSDYQWRAINTLEDLRTSPSVWTRCYYAQGHLGAFLDNLQGGVFVLKNKQTGMLKPIAFDLDYAFAEDLLRKAERLQPAVEQGVDPDPISYDPKICGSCGFRKICYPPRDFGEGAKVITDELLIEDIGRRHELKEDHDEFDELDASIKDRLKFLGIGEITLAGEFVIEGKKNKAGVVSYFIRKVGQ